MDFSYGFYALKFNFLFIVAGVVYGKIRLSRSAEHAVFFCFGPRSEQQRKWRDEAERTADSNDLDYSACRYEPGESCVEQTNLKETFLNSYFYTLALNLQVFLDGNSAV